MNRCTQTHAPTPDWRTTRFRLRQLPDSQEGLPSRHTTRLDRGLRSCQTGVARVRSIRLPQTKALARSMFWESSECVREPCRKAYPLPKREIWRDKTPGLSGSPFWEV